jgi:hypothetical protein
MFHNVGSDGVRLSPGQQVSFGPIGHDIVQTMFDVEGNGKVDEHGMYRAPLAATDRKFDVVKWTVYKDSKKGIVPSWMDFAIVLLD